MQVKRVMMADSYKYTQPPQYPDNIIGMYDYAEARSDRVYPKVVFNGLQYLLKEYFTTPITKEEVLEAAEYAEAHGVYFELAGWIYIVEELGGMLPVKIKAIPEGTLVNTKVPLFTMESTDKKVPWVVSWLETTLLKVWYPSNIATRSYDIKQMLLEYAELTQDTPDVIMSFCNFGDRGSPSPESASWGGMAHLTQFLGTDNFHSLKFCKDYYNAPINTIGFSISASEHSSTTSWGRLFEFDMMYKHIMFNKGKYIMAQVMDSYDYFKAVDTVTGSTRFRALIDSPDFPIFVMRPDSGDPYDVINRTLDIMEMNDVPYTINHKGFKVFKKYRIIWGDGINKVTIKIILELLVSRGYSSENIAFGSGGWLMQQHDRDTMGWAIKCSEITLEDGTKRGVAKDPITAPNKKSKEGQVTTYFNRATDEFFADLVGNASMGCPEALELVYLNGKMIKEYTLDEVRKNIKYTNTH
jgi:nicotinamide phosphoribosyltransferase